MFRVTIIFFFVNYNHIYGSPRIQQKLMSEVFMVSRKRLANLQGKIRRQLKVTKSSYHCYLVAPNVLA